MDQARLYALQTNTDNSMQLVNRESNLMWRSSPIVAPFESNRFPMGFGSLDSSHDLHRQQVVGLDLMNGGPNASRGVVAAEQRSIFAPQHHKTIELPLPPRAVRLRPSPPALPPLPASRAQSFTAVATPAVKKKRIRLKTDRRREQCRTNQARYRNKQRSFLQDLEKDVVSLRTEVERLRKTRLTLNLDVNARHSAVSWVRAYFECFCRDLSVTIIDNLDQRDGMRQLSQDDQIAFLRSNVRPDVILGDFEGIGVLIDQWRCISGVFDDVVVELLGIDSIDLVEPQTMLLCNTRCSFTISAKSIDTVFPHLEQNQRLRDKLIGKRLTISAAGEFCLDEHCQLQRLNCSFQFVPPMLSALGNAEDVVAVLNGSRITEKYMVDPLYAPRMIQDGY